MSVGVFHGLVLVHVNMPAEEALSDALAVWVVVMAVPMMVPVDMLHRVMLVGVAVAFKL